MRWLVAMTLVSLVMADRPLVGAIRWDAWFAGGHYERFLAPELWHDRLPFYGKVLPDGKVEVRSDTQDVMDREIAYASGAGLDFWAFCYYHPKSWPEADRYNYGWKLYLSSKRKKDLRFCLILQGGSHMGPKQEWPQTAAKFVELFKESTYQKVLGGRPLIFVFSCEYVEPHFGSAEEARKAFDLLREQSRKAGLGDPYIVAQVFSAAEGAKYVDAFGWDALSAYSAPGSGERREYPYADLASVNRWYWDSFKATGRKVIPTINTGWDGRPRLTDPNLAKNYNGAWYRMPAPAELAANLRAALDWNRANPDTAEANAVLIYAWNETDEGGWLVPTIKEGTARLDAIRGVLKDAKPLSQW
jgi:hypothetical protein